MRLFVPLLIVGLTAALTAAAIEFLPQTLYFPAVAFSTPEGLRVELLQTARLDEAHCRQTLDRLAQPVRSNCPVCRIVEQCQRGLDSERRTILSRAPLAVPSGRSQDGALTVTFSALDPNLALETCRETERLSANHPAPRRVRCFPSGTPR